MADALIPCFPDWKIGFLSRRKKRGLGSAPGAPIKKQNSGPIETFALKRRHTGFLKHAKKDKKGLRMASRMYLNTYPPTLLPDLHQEYAFDVNDDDAECFARHEILNYGAKPTYIFNVIYDPKLPKRNAVRPVNSSPNYALVRSWLDQCDKDHGQCRADGNIEKLKLITLIDVRGHRLVQYEPSMKYVALSYVWGGVSSPKRTHPHELPADISKTVQHAMIVADKIGIPFLWADAVCINQDDEEEKEQQLPLMDYIYEQAYATIIALGDNANVGLPGVRDGPRRHSQLIAEFGPVKLLSRCPTLSSQINESKWSSRGWTYQEGLFSRRCIFFSQRQVYFSCNSMLRTEDMPSAEHVPPTGNAKALAQRHMYWAADINYIRANTLWTEQSPGNLYTYFEYLGQYVCRDVSYHEDAINAFGAVLSRLQRNYLPKGFLLGIPREHFREGLMWAAAGSISRRKSGHFPSWTWAAWTTGDCGVTYGPVNSAFDDPWNVNITYPLSIRAGQDILFGSQATTKRLEGLGLELQGLWEAYSCTHKKMPPEISPRPPLINALYIEGPILTLPVTYDAVTQVIGFEAPAGLSKVFRQDIWPLMSEKCRDKITFGSLPAPKGLPDRSDFLVMRTKHVLQAPVADVQFSLMMLSWVGKDVATRAGMLMLTIEANLGEFWKFADVRRHSFWLA